MKIVFLECEDTDHIKITYNKKNAKEIHYIKHMLHNFGHRVKGFDEDHRACYIRIIDIYYIEIVDSKCYINTENKSYKASSVFKDIATYLADSDFVMCNKSTMVNMEHVIECQIYSECRRLLTLDNGERLIVNRKYREAFDDRFFEKDK